MYEEAEVHEIIQVWDVIVICPRCDYHTSHTHNYNDDGVKTGECESCGAGYTYTYNLV